MRFSLRRGRRMVGRTHEQQARIWDLQMKAADALARHRPDLLAGDNGSRKRPTEPQDNGSSRVVSE